MENLEEAIACLHQALDLSPSGHPNRSTTLINLAAAIYRRFQQLGGMKDLEDAIAFNRQALDLYPTGHLGRFTILNNLALAVSTRFELLGRMTDLEEAIASHRQALDLRPSGHPLRSISLSNLANTLRTRFEQLGTIENLEEAIASHRQALGLLPPGHPLRPTSLNDLAAALFAFFNQRGEMGDLEEAIVYHRQALDLCLPCHPLRSTTLVNLAAVLSVRFTKLGKREDLEKSVELFSDAESILPSSDPRHALQRSNIACSLLQLCHHSPRSDHILQMMSHAFALLESVVHHSASRAHDRFDAALRWVDAARNFRHSSTLRAYTAALLCLDRCVTVSPTIQSWQKFLVKAPSALHSDAASSAIEAGHLDTAVELLEQGRAILWSKMQGLRHPLDKLRDASGTLADQFDRTSRELERHAMSIDIESHLPGFYDQQTKKHRILSEKWDEAVRQIRQIDGFTNFLQAVPFSTLRLAATEGPVIIVNISQYRSDAIILLNSIAPVLVSLPNASPDTLRELAKDLSSALALDHDSWKGIHPILRKLWDIVVSLVVDRLSTLGVLKRSRIWWCPTGQLSALPLHAAGPYKRGQTNLPDIYISSYTPTLSSLIRARSDVPHRPTAPKLLVMGQPNDHLQSAKLPQVKEEIRRIQGLGISVDVLLGDKANREPCSVVSSNTPGSISLVMAINPQTNHSFRILSCMTMNGSR
jgi:tetratricopeptide (TPR) repeat protein